MTTTVKRRVPTPGRHVYDAIVVGGQVAGALTAAVLSRHGLKVLHAGHDGTAEGYVRGAYRLPVRPFLLPPLESVRVLEEVLIDLGVATTAHRAAHVPAPGFQLLGKGTWLTIPEDEASRVAEVERVLGDGAAAFEALLSKGRAAADGLDAYFAQKPDLPPEGFFGRWKFKRQVAELQGLEDEGPFPGASGPLAMVKHLLPLLAPVEAPNALTTARVLGKAMQGPAVWPQGREGLMRALLDRCAELGADVLSQDEALSSVVFEGSRAVGVRLRKSDAVYKSDHLVAACDLGTLLTLIPEARRPRLAALETAPTRGLFTVNTVVPARAVPPGLGELALVEAADDPELGAVLVQLGAARKAQSDADVGPEQVLTVSALAPLSLRKGGEAAARAQADRLWAVLAQVMPFTRRHAVLESIPWVDAPMVASGEVEPWPLFSLPADSALGVAALTCESPYKGLWLASRQVLPGLGFEGEVLAARRVAERIEALVRKKDPLKGRKASA